MRRQIIGGAAGWRCQQCAIANQFFHAGFAINGNLQLGGLRRHPQKRHLINRQCAMAVAVGVFGGHFKRMQQGHFGIGNALGQSVFGKFIHQKPDRAVMHAEDRFPLIHKSMQAGQHQPIAAQRDNDISIFNAHTLIARMQRVTRRLGGRVGAGYKSQFFAFCVAHIASNRVLHQRLKIATVAM